MLLRAALIAAFVFLSLFAWRGWKELPSFARIAAAAAVVIGIVMLRIPGALLASVLLTWALSAWIASRRR